MEENFENVFLQYLLIEESYFSKVYPMTKDYHFEDEKNLYIFKTLKKLYKEYNKKPTVKELALTLKNNETEDEILKHYKDLILSKKDIETSISKDFINNETVKFIKQSEMKQCIIDGAYAIKENKELTNIYERLGEALEFTLDKNLGVCINETDIRTEYYNQKQDGLSFGVKEIDDALGGGIYPKTLNIISAVTHGGKSLLLGQFAVNNILKGRNGVYLTLEIPELMMWKRLDSNLLGIPISQIKDYDITKEYQERTKDLNLGKLFVKEYGAGVLDVLMLESYIKELEVQENLKIDFICIDYLTLMRSYNFAKGRETSYQYYKSVSEELHRYAKESGIPILTASQLNRSAFNNINAGLDNMSESMGISMTADTIMILKRSEELDMLGHCILSFSKNRNTGYLGDVRIGVNFSTMSFHSLEG